jgi:mannose-6-phosphate isomerase-like protein (cupin superfamily)
MSKTRDYSINLDNKFGMLQRIDVPGLASQVKDKWFNQTLTQVNDCVVRLGVFEPGDFHWHKHDVEDEFFFVLEGSLHIDLEHESVTLFAFQGFTVPKGVMHRTRAPERTMILMMEGAGVVPTGDE